MTRLSAKLFGKVKVKVEVSPAGAEVDLVAAKGFTLTDADLALVASYKQLVVELGTVPGRVRPIAEKTAGLIRQGIDLAKSARQDFTGLAMLRTLPSVVRGLVTVTNAVSAIKNDLPVVVKRTESMLVEAKRSMGLEPKVSLGIDVASLFDLKAVVSAAVPSTGALPTKTLVPTKPAAAKKVAVPAGPRGKRG
jgi:hypothetical protein